MTAARSILIVEDEPLIAMMLEDFLNSSVTASTGPATAWNVRWTRPKRADFDLAILDVNLKGENVARRELPAKRTFLS